MDVSGQPRNSGAARIGELATLPVFFDLKGKPVLVAGESDGAAWKAELLASCGAEVHLFARLEEASDAIRVFAARADVVHHDCGWEAAYFRHFALAIGDCAPEEARAFHDRAREAGVPVNVIDQPEFCQFKFGSIVNRSPLVIGISTDGAAPILAQTVRRKIEALLPRQLKLWAELAQAMRGRVNEMLETVPARRQFWERFADLAFDGSADTMQAEKLLKTANQSSDRKTTGRVSVVGAGPGDAELLTLKAVRALQAADVILFDDAVPTEVLELARREARRVSVNGASAGRRGNVATMAVDLAIAGKRVVRLVAGDPAASITAREGIADLRREGIPVDVIRGVSAGDEADLPAKRPARVGSVHLFAGQYHRGGAPLPSAPAQG
jgi:uroporphyrin-III C-methyltransferase/precorrin-2 dehydrogenase/sirohydrochlorin ferrochelatase